MGERDFRGFLDVLRRAGELVEVDEPISAVHELARRVDASEAAENRAFLFRRVIGHTGPVAAGLYGSTHRHLLGLRLRGMAEFADRLDAAIRQPLPPVIERGEAPCQEVRFPAEAGLDRLPIPTLSTGDGGPYVTSGVVALRDGSRRNAGVYRMQVHGPRRLTILTNRFHDGHRILDAALAAGRTVDVAISIGVDPAVFVSAFWPVAPGIEEFAVAGALLGQPLVLAPATTIDLEVPAHAEIVIEGRIRPGSEETEGPFADITGQITGAGRQPVIDVTAITTRRDPVFHSVLAFNSREHFKSRRNDFWRDYQATGRVRLPGLPEEVLGTTYRLYFPPSARNFHAVVAIAKRDDEQPRRLIQAMFETYRYLKRVVVVDDDIDIRDPLQVEWAQATRVGRPAQITLTRGFGSRIDTSADEEDGQVVKMGIDATVPRAQEKEILGPGVREDSTYISQEGAIP